MTRKPDIQKPPRRPAKPFDGYQGYRHESGMTPRQLVDSRRAELLAVELAEKRGELVKQADVDAAQQAFAEVQKNDMMHALSSMVLTHLPAGGVSSAQVKVAVDTAVRELLNRWASGAAA